MVGKHWVWTRGGFVFSQAATPLGLAIPIYTATAIAGGMPIWNPPNSGVEVELCSVDIDYGSGTADFGAIGLMGVPLTAIATGAVCTAFAETTPFNGRCIGGQASKVRSSNAGAVTVTAGVATAPTAAAPGWMRSLASINLEAATGTAHGTGIATYDFNGTVCVPEGFMVYLAATKASVALYASTIIWKEHPITRV